MYQLAQINIAKMIGVTINDPIMKAFVDNLDTVNSLAEASEGFIWRLKDETNNASNFNPLNNEQIIINISVWETIASLEHFTYKTFHTDFIKRKKEWFKKYGEAHYALWWIKKGDFPNIEDALEKLTHLQQHGPTAVSFSFKKPFPKPIT
jgi:hypothetical protein